MSAPRQLPGAVFEDQDTIGREGGCQERDPAGWRVFIGRVGKDQVEAIVRDPPCIACSHLDVCPQFRGGRRDLTGGPSVLLRTQDHPRASAPGLQGQDARTSKSVPHPGPFKSAAQDVEDGLADPRRGRP